VAATSLPRWILGHYVIGVGTRTAWWGRARLPEGRARLPDGRARPLEYKTMSPKTGQKCDKIRVFGQNKLFSENPALKPLGSFRHMAACRSSLENT
jgi:hypothetical protein